LTFGSNFNQSCLEGLVLPSSLRCFSCSPIFVSCCGLD